MVLIFSHILPDEPAGLQGKRIVSFAQYIMSKEVLLYCALSDQFISPTFCYPTYYPWYQWSFLYHHYLFRVELG